MRERKYCVQCGNKIDRPRGIKCLKCYKGRDRQKEVTENARTNTS